jgi:hypothetical protein
VDGVSVIFVMHGERRVLAAIMLYQISRAFPKFESYGVAERPVFSGRKSLADGTCGRVGDHLFGPLRPWAELQGERASLQLLVSLCGCPNADSTQCAATRTPRSVSLVSDCYA